MSSRHALRVGNVLHARVCVCMDTYTYVWARVHKRLSYVCMCTHIFTRTFTHVKEKRTILDKRTKRHLSVMGREILI